MLDKKNLLNTVEKTAPYFAIFMAVVFIVVGYWFGQTTRSFEANSIPAQLSVVRVDAKLSTSMTTGQTQGRTTSKMLYRPRFETIADDGQPIQYEGNIWSAPKPHEPGDVVVGRYEIGTGILISDKMLWGEKIFSFVFMLIGFIGITICVGYLMWRARRA